MFNGLYKTHTTYETKIEDKLMLGMDPFKDLKEKLIKIQEASKIMHENASKPKAITHTLDSENLNGMALPEVFELVKKEFQKKDSEIETLKARLDVLELIIESKKDKKYI